MNHKFNKESMILIDLSKHKSSLFIELLKDHNLDGKVCPEALVKFKNNGYIKLWIDSVTFELIAFTHENSKREIQFNIDFISQMKLMKSISIKDKEIKYDIDNILDKISLAGMDSLTTNELKFLNSLKK